MIDLSCGKCYVAVPSPEQRTFVLLDVTCNRHQSTANAAAATRDNQAPAIDWDTSDPQGTLHHDVDAAVCRITWRLLFDDTNHAEVTPGPHNQENR